MEMSGKRILELDILNVMPIVQETLPLFLFYQSERRGNEAALPLLPLTPPPPPPPPPSPSSPLFPLPLAGRVTEYSGKDSEHK